MFETNDLLGAKLGSRGFAVASVVSTRDSFPQLGARKVSSPDHRVGPKRRTGPPAVLTTLDCGVLPFKDKYTLTLCASQWTNWVNTGDPRSPYLHECLDQRLLPPLPGLACAESFGSFLVGGRI